MGERAVAVRGNGQGMLSVESKLAFAETLLASDTLVETAQLGIDWLTRHAAVREAAIALIDIEREGGARLIGVASAGIDPSAAHALSVDLEERDHPLVIALTS